MKKLVWWFRIVGGFYLLLALMNLYFVLLNPNFVDGMMTWDRQYAIGNQFSGLPGFQRVAGGKDDFRH